ncbi:MAG TPA: hypothetical protein VKA55_01555 [Gammaproteobacteria bacterium]|nr:hypothetical protein [Gammaproteobacteria bacterium]
MERMLREEVERDRRRPAPRGTGWLVAALFGLLLVGLLLGVLGG